MSTSALKSHGITSDVSRYPAAPDYERYVLGAALSYAEFLHQVRTVIEDDDFTLQKHRDIWQAICAVYDGGAGSIDYLIVHAELMRVQKHAAIGGLGYLVSLRDGMPESPMLESYVALLKDKTALRRLMYTCENAINRCMEGYDKAQSILDGMTGEMMNLVPRATSTELQSCAELIEEVGIQTLMMPRKMRGLAFPWSWMNYMTGGMIESELWVLAAQTSVGKTSAAMQVALNTARHGKGVAIFSLEVGKTSLFQKAVGQISGVDQERAKRGQLTSEDIQRQGDAAMRLHNYPIYLNTQCASPLAIHAALRRRRIKSSISLVIVDYLQLLDDPPRSGNKAQAVSANARAMKMLATEFNVPVLLLSQFSRQKTQDGKAPPKPQLDWLKESGDIENHANGVWFIHRECMVDAEIVPVTFMLPKQRDGRRYIETPMTFVSNNQTFTENTDDAER